MKSLKVPLKKAESVKNRLSKQELLDFDYSIKKDANNIFFPLKCSEKVVDKFPDLDIVEKKFVKKKKKLKFKKELKRILSEKDFSQLPKSYDIVGTIAILEIPEDIKNKEKKIAKALLDSNKNIKTILRKADIHKGKYRTQKMKYIIGENTKETIHKENNVKLKLDVEKVYFSVRSGTERKRIMQQVKPKEDVLVMFSGCAPFPLVIAKNTEANVVCGIEMNPVAHKYAEQNTKLNKINNIELIKGDVTKVFPKLNRKFDRIVMPLPKTSEEFLPLALTVSKKGTMIHLYLFLSEKQYPEAKSRIAKIFKRSKFKHKILRIVKCGQYSPDIFRTCIDIKIA